MTPEETYWITLIVIMGGCFGLGFAAGARAMSRKAQALIIDRLGVRRISR
ncbi:MAG: hypothetical protein ACJ79X_06795 [Gemmatimonadaceae bacterium]|jgi:hypothetical protein